MSRPATSLDLLEQADTIFADNANARRLNIAIRLNRARRQQTLDTHTPALAAIQNANKENNQMIDENAAKVIMVSDDQENMKRTKEILEDALDKKSVNIESKHKNFDDVFINFHITSSSRFIKYFSKKLFHGDALGKGPVMERTVESSFKAFVINFFSLADKRFFVDPTPRTMSLQQLNIAIQTASLQALYKLDFPIRMIKAVCSEDNLSIMRNEIEFYLKIGVDINSQDKNGNTALHWTLKNNDIDIAVLLINNGANYELKNKKGKTPIDVAKNRATRTAALAAIKTKQQSKSKDSDNNNDAQRSFGNR